MGSATREALASSKKALSDTGRIDLATATDLFAAGRVIGESGQLRSLLADPSGEASVKASIVDRVFRSQLSAQALDLLREIVSARWSNPDDLLGGIEELGLRAAAVAAGPDARLDAQLFAFSQSVSSDAGLELALGSKLGGQDSKSALVQKLLSGNGSAETVEIVKHLVLQPRGRRIGELLRHAASVIADQQGYIVATVTSAFPLGAAQVERLEKGLAAQYGRKLRINQVVDPSVIGGLRVQVGDDVIDGSISSRLSELRLQLAG
ncbi:F0F1 ATP synthase subunit delta [Mycetocola sp. 2940]|uniref:F0F1 ATP synthase subunit delta n=1 Tax=Mycetocola sp. 2940 TaxID=3156452 RepID=UPI003399CFE8